MSVFPPILWYNGARGWLALLVNLPLFLVTLALIFGLFFPLTFGNTIYLILTCRKVTLGTFLNPLVGCIHMVTTYMYRWNPLFPHGMLANFGKLLFATFGPVFYLIGRCFDCCRKRRAKREGIVEDIPVGDVDFNEVKVSEGITVVSARFSEGLESQCTMTIIRHSDWVMFFNPIFGPLELYKQHGQDTKRQYLWLPTLMHHMAADIVKAAFPDIEMWGSAGAGLRHEPPLKINDPVTSKFDLEGFTTFNLPGTVYDERWLHYEPAKLLLVGDFQPLIDECIDLPLCFMNCMIGCASCGDHCTMLTYTKSLVTNPDEVLVVLKAVLALKWDRLEGAHLTTKATRKDFLEFWYWLLPSELKDGDDLGVELLPA